MAEITGYSSLLEELKNNNKKAELLVSLRDWLNRILEFDPESGEALSDDLTHFLDKNHEFFQSDNADKNVFDYIHNILSYSGRSVFHIFESPRKEILRFHEQMKVYQAHEIDSAGIIEICRRPGRTVREKIAVKPSVLAVKRQQSIDTLENRLLKKLIIKLSYILEERNKVYSEIGREDEDSMLSALYAKLCRWLKSSEAEEIGEWQKLPPNNILLCDKFYKKVWRTWRFLLDLDEFVQEDFEKLNEILAAFVFWNTASDLQHRGAKIKQAPLNFDSKNFFVETVGFSNSEIRTENFALTLEKNLIKFKPVTGEIHEIKIEFENFEVDGKTQEKLETLLDALRISKNLADTIYKSEAGKERVIVKNISDEQKFAVIDFSQSPYESEICSTDKKLTRNHFPKDLLRQFWAKRDSSDIHNVDCAVSPDLYSENLNDWTISQVSFDDVLHKEWTESKIPAEIETEAVYNFMNSLRDFYNTGTFYYLIPDYIEDFSLKTIRSSANSVFSSANPVPQSIGAVFDFQMSERFKKLGIKDKDFVFVIEKKKVETGESYKEIFSVTPVCARTEYKKNDKEIINLKDFTEIPCGIRWEHHPPHIDKDYKPNKVFDDIKYTAEHTEGFKESSQVFIISPEESIKNARLEMPDPKWHFVNEPFNAVLGLAASVLIQEKVREIPLWSEHLPVLQMSVIKNGKRDGINLTNGKVVLPIRGKSQPIEISKTFTLGKNVKEYHFRLTRGEGDASSSLKYEAVLQNPEFPLKKAVECELEMSYTYGQEQPFDLRFRPKSSAPFIRAQVQWNPIDESAFPVPNFPEERKWEEFLHWKDNRNPDGKDLIEWEESNFSRILDLQNFYLGKENGFNRYTRKFRKIPDFRYRDKQGQYYCLCQLDETKLVKFYRNHFNDIYNMIGSDFSFSLKPETKSVDALGREIYQVSGVKKGKNLYSKTIISLACSFRFPTMQIWNIRNSVLNDENVPDLFKEKTARVKEALAFLLNNENVKKQERLWNELFLFACILHSDSCDLTADFMRELLSKEFPFLENWRTIEQKCFQFGYFIGDASSEIQKEVFDWALDFEIKNKLLRERIRDFKLQVLTIALWRSENLLKEIEITKFKALFEQTVNAIDSEFSNLQKKFIREEKISNRKLIPIRSYLELLCALIRCRHYGKDFQDLLSPFNPKIQETISKIEKIYEWLKNIGKTLYTRQIRFISSDQDSEEGFLDYLLQWLDGQKSSEMPKIESATDDDESDGNGDSGDSEDE